MRRTVLDYDQIVMEEPVVAKARIVGTLDSFGVET